MPKFGRMSERFKPNPNIIFAQINWDENFVEDFNVKRFPTLKFIIKNKNNQKPLAKPFEK